MTSKAESMSLEVCPQDVRSCLHKGMPSPDAHAYSYRPLLTVNSCLYGCESLITTIKWGAILTLNAADRGEQVAYPVGPKCIILVCCHITNNPHQVPFPGPMAELGLTKCHTVLVSNAKRLHCI